MIKSYNFKEGKQLVEIQNLFHIIESDSRKITIQLADSNHSIFQAHFPKNHLLPGFCHIDILALILKDSIKKVNFLKLKRKTLPNETISYEIVTSDNKRKIKILNKQEQLIGNFSYEY